VIAHRVRVGPLPAWMDVPRLLGLGAWTADGDGFVAELPTADAADLAARLRGLGFGGHAVEVEVTPPLSRAVVRAARTEDARRRRDTSPGFLRRDARVDDEGRYSLTPEPLAVALGARAAGRSVLDAGCGCGGNTLGFARAGCRVTAVERDPGRLALARHNARVYGVADRVRFVAGDAVAAAAATTCDLVFVDPPWGTDWDRRVTTTLPLLDAVREAVRGRAELWAKVPPSFDPPADAVPWFGVAAGDARRVKFLVVRWPK
jgi:SAM-dependent methyltransferase